ncbi:unnamed protein product [Symbiodinium sp. CCMP2592]|nr:unnamed protein product [Symbiodinium sp. CCMP2592]
MPHSHAAEELLEMIGSGKSHVAHAQSLAVAMVRDGIPQEAVTAFASLGSFGAHESNAERDLHRWLRGLYGVTLEPYFIDVMLEKDDADIDDIGEQEDNPLKGTASTRIPVLLPHEVFSAIHSSSDHQVSFGLSMLGRHSPAAIKQFWRHLQRYVPEEVKDHPALAGCDLSEMIQLLIHFDGAEMYKNSEYNIWSFSSALSSLLDVDCLETQFVCCILPQKAMQQKQVKNYVHKEIARLMSWSFKVLQSGKFPSTGFYGEEFPSTSCRAKRSGTALAGEWKACFYGFRGDQKARRECHYFSRHYNCIQLCDRCCAKTPTEKHMDDMNFKNFSANAPFLLTAIDHNMYLNTTPSAELSPWTAMPGWKIENTFFDWMHIVLLGIARDVVAAAIKLMAMRGVISMTNLRLELKSLTAWIKKERKSDEELLQMAVVVRALNKAQRLLDHSDLLMTEQDSTRFNELVQLHLRTWQRLALKFEALGIALCKIRPKHHYLQHIGLYVASTRVNVRIHQNFNSESYMGKMKKIAVKCHSISMMLRVQQRYVLYLALSWERAKRASTGAGAALTGKETLEELLLCDDRPLSSSSAEYAKRRCIMGIK